MQASLNRHQYRYFITIKAYFIITKYFIISTATIKQPNAINDLSFTKIGELFILAIKFSSLLFKLHIIKILFQHPSHLVYYNL